MTQAVFNFCAGPAMLPASVMKQAQAEMLDWQGQGVSVMEMSHRSKPYMQMAAEAEQDLRDLMAIPSNYKVLFLHGGGRGQFAGIPLNLSRSADSADYLLSGQWSRGALAEGEKYLHCKVAGEPNLIDGKVALPPQSALNINPDAAYFHYCPNETIEGVEFSYIPDAGHVPVVADMSSTILSQPLDVSRFGVIYAGAQKNIGPSGLSVVIVREDLIGNARQETPSILDYGLAVKHDSMYNTPPTYAWYLAGLVFKWLKSNGGLTEMAKVNRAKADTLYRFIDGSDFYRNNVDDNCRSKMNVPFQLADDNLDSKFLELSDAAGLKALKGHRIVGGMRASIYNAMPLSGVQALVDFMADFEKKFG
ncbi:3-phosphoserine/phosphohydroxythreonine transaminase [Corallincola luteus]|uniref:Phosphoserine aminotransferase n=2 Tax=Corallincola TaxID=1775176 RepID=A0A368NQY5_9GAMM|nr:MULTISPECIES: 3-phosphoserine/phosphohydroxythreonine transaminase [Corallincola]RCU52818.1 3-phosphoserine/phosphohydroxythreonine transaminase [Corallincola holothuriorum]TCI03317.1 3-phosphoserine/phosphohydroxythreonine transaminase [Corallincola luteus]